jgi:hypothetical protein
VNTLKLIHEELEVHKIELKCKTKNYSWLKSKQNMYTEKYLYKLYDYAPSAYFTLSIDGKVIEANLNGALC